MTPISPKGSEHNKRAEEVARRIMGYATNLASKDFNRIEIIAKALEEYGTEVERLAGEAGFRVGSSIKILEAEKKAFEAGAASMRERALIVAMNLNSKKAQSDGYSIAKIIKALPLSEPEVKNG